MATLQGGPRVASGGHRRTVLVVEDDRSVREVVRDVLEDAGYDVLEERDGEPALRLLRAAPDPLVVLLDMQMPRLDGLGVLRAVDANPQLAARGHAYVLMTASVEAERPDARALLGRLGVPLLGKPFDVDELLAAVASAGARLPNGEAAGRR